MQLLPRREIIKVVDKIKINEEDFTYTTDYVWCMEVVVLFSTATEGCVRGPNKDYLPLSKIENANEIPQLCITSLKPNFNRQFPK